MPVGELTSLTEKKLSWRQEPPSEQLGAGRFKKASGTMADSDTLNSRFFHLILPPAAPSNPILDRTEQPSSCRRTDPRFNNDDLPMNGGYDSTNIDTDWIHDKYEDDPQARRPTRGPRNAPARIDRYSPEIDSASPGGKLRVDNLHYDLTEDDLEDLFTRIGPITTLSLRFDRAGRSSGTAFVTYSSPADARRAIHEFDGANANGQPIRLTFLPSAPAADIGIRGRGAKATPRNPFDTAVKPGRSLFDRIENPGRNGGSRDRSRSPGAPRRTDTRKPPPEGVDRYVPGDPRSRSWSPVGRRRTRTPVGRRARSPRGDGGRGRGRRDDRGGREMVNGRPRKTQEELDREMEDYWVGKGKGQSNGAGNEVAASEAVAAPVIDEDIDMAL